MADSSARVSSMSHYSDGANLGSFDIGNTDQNPSQGIAFDGTNIWAANSGTNGAPGNTVTKLNSNGQILGTFVVGSAPEAMAFDGAHIWVSNNNSGTVTEIDVRSGATLGTFATGVLPNGIGFDGANIRVANSGSNTVTRRRVSERGAGPRSQTFAVGTCPINGVAFDGANVWVTNGCSNNLETLALADDISSAKGCVTHSPPWGWPGGRSGWDYPLQR